MKTAVLIDTMSIQKYVFSSNNLKENIGASYLVKHLFDELEVNFKKNSYIGGGNALLYFENEDEAKNEMKKWSKEVLVKYPGIIPIIAIDDCFKDGKEYAQSRKNIIEKLIENKNQFIPITNINSFGITTECSNTGLSAEIYSKLDKKYISSISFSKVNVAQEANKNLRDEFANIIGNFEFPSKLDELGGTRHENNHIAVVHIDGNDMGEKFKEIKKEKDLKEFSEKLENATMNSFKEMIKKLIEDIKTIQKELSLESNFLPIRPIIIGGDDITFVCDARLALYFTKNFIEQFKKQKVCIDKKISVCAGISIVKTKYPFYRAYTLAEELCSNAKKKRHGVVEKDKSKDDSYIDFHISYGGLGNSLEEIREKNYKSVDNKTLCKRPYSLKQISVLLTGIKSLSKLPQSKVKKLRDVLTEGQTATEEYIIELGYRDIKLPEISHSDELIKGFSNSETTYIDIIEMMDFCPDFFIDQGGKNG